MYILLEKWGDDDMHAYVYVKVGRVKYDGLLKDRHVLPVLTVFPLQWDTSLRNNMAAINEFLGVEALFVENYDIHVSLRGMYPQILAELPLPEEMPKEHSTNPKRKVKILVVE